MATKRGDNVGSSAAIIGRVDSRFEMECYEQLGPLSRQAINEAPLKILAAPIVIDIKKFFEEKKIDFDLHAQKLDASIAKGIRGDTLRTILKDRTEQDALLGMKPLRGAPGAARKGRRIYR
jgi:hypothetical protein